MTSSRHNPVHLCDQHSWEKVAMSASETCMCSLSDSLKSAGKELVAKPLECLHFNRVRYVMIYELSWYKMAASKLQKDQLLIKAFKCRWATTRMQIKQYIHSLAKPYILKNAAVMVYFIIISNSKLKFYVQGVLLAQQTDPGCMAIL